MAVNPFCGRIDNDVRAPVEGVAQISSRTESVVDNQGHVVFTGYFGNPLDVGNYACRVTHAFDKHGAGAVIDERCEIFG